MTLASLVSDLFTGSDSTDDTSPDEPGESEASPTVLYECRTCGTNVSADATHCPACDDADLVRYSID